MLKISDLEKLNENLTIKEVKEKIKAEYPFLCPKCKGKGEVYIPDGFGDGRTGDYYTTCSLCNGYGRTKEQKKAVYKIIRYE